MLFTGLCEHTYGQQNKFIYGKVTDEQGRPIANASVYLSHTTKGVTCSYSGTFRLENLPDGKYDLVISAIGYEAKIFSFSSDNYLSNLEVSLVKRATELSEVVVRPVDKNGWRKYGKYFTDNFIGKTRNAKNCRILNHEAIRFRFADQNNTLTVKADEPIIIENKMLGYRISFQLISFTSDFNDDIVAFVGYPLFTDLSSSNHKIISNRRQAYRGSLMHFMRAAYNDSLSSERFIVKAKVTRPNFEKERVRNILQTVYDSAHLRHEVTELSFGAVQTKSGYQNLIPGDSLRYYKKVIAQRDSITKRETLETLKEIITIIEPNSKLLFFSNAIEIIYGNNRSEIILKTPAPLEIMKNGSYFSPTELVAFGYWSEQEKVCNMLPFDYSPDTK